ncbi:serine/threonine-protein kinase [Catellatospora vulcania]|uniref:serine/threonine-protein kinase n=1 Tax=Catellatospora vulcania TaxID=1460450 RepID=UPI0012D42290|nr:serine/threonine-protein kinase [Catellatospora vulcania]
MTTTEPVRLNGRYRLDQRIGAGGMGEVWRATDELLGRTVAVKTVLPSLADDADFARRFLAEARAMAGVHHRGVVAIHDLYSGPEGAYLVMEFVDGEPLSQVLARYGRLAAPPSLHLVGQAADALHAVHGRGIVHRDVKPGNMLVRPDGTLLLTDFGIARRDGATALTATGAVIGTLSYLAPEQVLGHPATPRSDVYALGVVAYECLTGRRPFTAENPFAAAMMRLNQAPPPLGPHVPAPVAALVERALAVEPNDRWADAATFGTAIAQVAAALRSGVAPTPVPHSAEPTVVQQRSPLSPTLLEPGLAATAVATPHSGTPHAAMPAVPRTGGGLAASNAEATVLTPRPNTAPPFTPGTGTPGGVVVPPGFRPRDGYYVPVAPMCWGGLVIPGGLGRTPRRIAPDEEHYWETFAAAELPEDAVYLRQEELLGHPAVAAVCTARVLAASSRDPARTVGWELEPWPVQLGRDRWIFHCLAGPGTGEWLGSEFA